jgi:hypothetical protein
MDVVEQLEAEYTFEGQEDSPNAAATEREQLDHQLQAIQSSLNRLKAKLAKFNIEAK